MNKQLKNNLTQIQKDTLKLITQFYKKYGYPCTQVYLARHYNVTPTTMHQRIISMENKGIIRRTPDGQVIPKL